MPKKPETKLDLLQGTLNMMVMRTRQAGAANGYEIAKPIERLSDEVLAVNHGSLYPALLPAGEEWRDCGERGDLFDESAGALLPVDGSRAKAAASRPIEMGTNDGVG
jgi:hypothetical protein